LLPRKKESRQRRRLEQSQENRQRLKKLSHNQKKKQKKLRHLNQFLWLQLSQLLLLLKDHQRHLLLDPEAIDLASQ
jgi:hypothetical protein